MPGPAPPPTPAPRPSAPRAIHDRWDLVVVIAVGGALGSLARWGVGTALPHPAGGFAWGTFVANLSGALVLGALMALTAGAPARSRYLRPLLGVGFLGGYTTFSTYMLDTRAMVAAGRPGVALVYVGSTLALGLLAVWIGLVAGRSVVVLVTRRRRRGPTHEPAGQPSSPEPGIASSDRRTGP